MPFYLSKDMFDTVVISVAFDVGIEIVSQTGVFQRQRAVDENHIVNVVFLAELCEKLL